MFDKLIDRMNFLSIFLSYKLQNACFSTYKKQKTIHQIDVTILDQEHFSKLI